MTVNRYGSTALSFRSFKRRAYGPAYLSVLKSKCAINNQASLPLARIIPAADNLLFTELQTCGSRLNPRRIQQPILLKRSAPGPTWSTEGSKANSNSRCWLV